jgi:hypothetical protein
MGQRRRRGAAWMTVGAEMTGDAGEKERRLDFAARLRNALASC